MNLNKLSHKIGIREASI